MKKLFFVSLFLAAFSAPAIASAQEQVMVSCSAGPNNNARTFYYKGKGHAKWQSGSIVLWAGKDLNASQNVIVFKPLNGTTCYIQYSNK